MDHFDYRDRTLYCEDVPVPELAEKYGTPLYVYGAAEYRTMRSLRGFFEERGLPKESVSLINYWRHADSAVENE